MQSRAPSWHWLWLPPIIAIALAPPIYWGVQSAMSGWDEPWRAWAGFGRVFNRVLLVAALAVLAPLLWQRGYRSFESLGLRRPMAAGVIRGAGWGLILGAALLLSQTALGARIWHPELVLIAAVGAALTALLVAMLEEVLFREILLGELCRSGLVVRLAIAVQALVFAALHFLRPPGFGADYAVHWASGVELIAATAGQFVEEPTAIMRAATLFLLGITTGVARIAWNSLAWPIGFHAGLVAAVQWAPMLTDTAKHPWRAWLPKDISSGIDAALLLALFTVGMGFYVGRASNR